MKIKTKNNFIFKNPIMQSNFIVIKFKLINKSGDAC